MSAFSRVFEYFRHAHDSPLAVDQCARFGGLRYFPEDESYRFTVTVDATGGGGTEEIEMSDGSTSRLGRLGTVRFDVDGERVALVAYKQGDELFIPFRDATRGKETYGAGRYVDGALGGRSLRARLQPRVQPVLRVQRCVALPSPPARELAPRRDPRRRARLPLAARPRE
jgi:hypothetical protein